VKYKLRKRSISLERSRIKRVTLDLYDKNMQKGTIYVRNKGMIRYQNGMYEILYMLNIRNLIKNPPSLYENTYSDIQLIKKIAKDGADTIYFLEEVK